MKPIRGQVWRVRFDPSEGNEIKKERPAVVMTEEGIGKLALQIVVPITDWKPKYHYYPWFTYIKPTRRNGLYKESGADAFQVKSLSEDRLLEHLGQLTADQLENIAAAVAICVGYI